MSQACSRGSQETSLAVEDNGEISEEEERK